MVEIFVITAAKLKSVSLFKGILLDVNIFCIFAYSAETIRWSPFFDF